MSLVIAAIMLWSSVGTAPQEGAGSGAASVAAAADPASIEDAQAWLALVDRGEWEASWRDAAPFFKSQITAAQWAGAMASVRKPLGAVSSRKVEAVTRASALPGVPAGEYEVITLKTDFAEKPGAIETITLVRQGDEWKVVGYFIR